MKLTRIGTDESALPAGADALLQQWYRQIDAAIDACSSSVAMAVRVMPGQRIEGFGTAFFYSRHGWPFLVTAGHVLEDVIDSIQRGRGAGLLTRGRKAMIHLSKLEFFHQKELDIAVAPLWKQPSQTYAHVTFFDEKQVCPNFPEDRLYAFTGFPWTKNKTYTGREIRPHQRIATFAKHSLESIDDASPFVYFPVEPDRLHTSDLKPTQWALPDGARGMSGGPVFAVRGTPFKPILDVCGIGTAWVPQSNHVKALRFELFDAWLSQHLHW
ncbi:hypothetical protein DWU98_16505 [Dyella monticola]|uniref:Serine protease n=1 Tax=Dyella monticola TaxID=1927958 RepID=A0A370WUI1_9GAMM|nr:trypsin-like peptidase domain-containing protein [Dyella monticola]RDS79667.1 hypothetical protein DWU98_16505 [Dyella monticola]